MTEIIRVENLSKKFINKKDKTEVLAVDSINFSVNSGEIFGFLGPNGAGKTTTIRMLACLLRPTLGNAIINGMSILEEQENIRSIIGFLTENHGNYETLTVKQNLEFFGKFYNIQNLNERIEDILEQFEMLDRIEMYAGELSKGLKQRLALARTLIHDPKILFFDEPTAGLDPIAAVKVRELILKLKSKNRTIFINSHNLEEVQKVCDRVGIIDEGRIKRIGTSDEIGKNLWEFRILEIKLKKLSDEIISRLSKFDFIKEVFLINGCIRIHLKNLEEFTPIIVEKIVELGGKIISVEPIEYSLEDIYIKLMEDSKINQQSGEK